MDTVEWAFLKAILAMAKSQKPPVIQHIFESLWDSQTKTLARTVVTKTDVVSAIQWAREALNSTLSTENPANFIKDVIRGNNASGMWPEKLRDLRWTARQVTGDGNCFEFMRYEEGHSEPFPNRFGFHPRVNRHRVQSLSMPLATKELGRDDETYLIQVAVKLAVIETHFALESPLKIQELNHLQIGIKLRLCEIDSMFAATYLSEDGVLKRLIITAEAKKKNQRILEEQVMKQVRAAFEETNVDLVVPLAMTAVGLPDAKGIYVVEFKAIQRSGLDDFNELTLESEALYELVPPVPGI